METDLSIIILRLLRIPIKHNKLGVIVYFVHCILIDIEKNVKEVLFIHILRKVITKIHTQATKRLKVIVFTLHEGACRTLLFLSCCLNCRLPHLPFLIEVLGLYFSVPSNAFPKEAIAIFSTALYSLKIHSGCKAISKPYMISVHPLNGHFL